MQSAFSSGVSPKSFMRERKLEVRPLCPHPYAQPLPPASYSTLLHVQRRFRGAA